MSTEFSGITSYAGWKAKLKTLLAVGEEASRRNDDDARLSVAARLNSFVLESAPNAPEIVALDDLAITAARALTAEVVGGGVDRISGRTAMLRSIGKQLDAVAAQAEQAAASIRLEKIHRLVDALTQAVRAVDELDTVLKTGSDEALRTRLTALAGAMREVRSRVDDSARG